MMETKGIKKKNNKFFFFLEKREMDKKKINEFIKNDKRRRQGLNIGIMKENKKY